MRAIELLIRRPLACASLSFALSLAGCGSPRHASDGGPADLAFAFGDQMPSVCAPGDPPSCSDDATVQVCRSNGTGYDYQPCLAVGSMCKDGACTCAPGSTRCNGQAVQKCAVDGTWMDDHTCPIPSRCQDGTCGDPRCDDETMSTNPHALPVNAWPRFRHDNRNTGSTPTVMADMPKLKWKVPIGGASLNQGGLSSGVVVNQSNVLFIGGGDLDMNGGALDSLDAMGKFIYRFPAMRGFASSTPAVRADGTAYFSSQDAHLYAVDPMGKQVWQYTTGSQADSSPIVTRDGNIIYSSDDHSLYALDFNGQLIWKTDPGKGPGEVDGGLSESCDGKIIVGGRNNGFYALDAKTGNNLWMVPTMGGDPGALFSSPLVTADGTVYGFDSAGFGYAIDPMGKVIWQKNFVPKSFAGACPAKIGNLLVVFLNDGQLHGIDATNGMPLWAQPVGHPATELNSGPVVDGKQRIYYSSNDGFVYAFDIAGKPLWKIPSSGKDNPSMDINATIAIGNDATMYVAANDGSLYAFQ